MAIDARALIAISDAIQVILCGQSVLDHAVEIEVALKRAGYTIVPIARGAVNKTRTNKHSAVERCGILQRQRDNALEEISLLREAAVSKQRVTR